MAEVTFRVVWGSKCDQPGCNWSEFGHWDDLRSEVIAHHDRQHRAIGNWSLKARALRMSAARTA